MICKYCGSQLSDNICPSCNKVMPLSYTSHELADLFGKRIIGDQKPNEIQATSDYNRGFTEGEKHGYSKGYVSAQKESAEALKRRQRFFIIATVSGAVALALLSSIITGVISNKSGYRKGILAGKHEQEYIDKSKIEDAFSDGYKSGKGDGYDAGYSTGYKEGQLVTPTPSPTPSPTPEPLMLSKGAEGEHVRQLQERLISLGYLAENEADGRFGPKTQKAVEQFQTDNGFEPTGIIDQEQWDFIMSEKPVIAKTEIPTATATFDIQTATVTPTIPSNTAAPSAQSTEAAAFEAVSDDGTEENTASDTSDILTNNKADEADITVS